MYNQDFSILEIQQVFGDEALNQTLWRVSAKFIPKLLMEKQKELHVEIIQDMLDCSNNDLEFTKTILTGNETWVYCYNPENNFQSSQWKHLELPRPKKA